MTRGYQNPSSDIVAIVKFHDDILRDHGEASQEQGLTVQQPIL